jgi:hypothetical protein
MPATSFQAILDKALDDYREQIGVELDKHPFAGDLRGSDSPDKVLKLLEDKANAFKTYRDGNRKLIDWLSPVVQVVHTLSGVLGEAVSLVSHRRYFFLDVLIVRLLGTVPTSKGDLCWRRCSNRGACPLTLAALCFLICIPQAADGVSSSYDALVDLFECVGNFLKRLRIYTDVPMSPSMTDIIVKIMVELLSVFALATKQIKQGRFSKQIVIFKTR